MGEEQEVTLIVYNKMVFKGGKVKVDIKFDWKEISRMTQCLEVDWLQV